MTMFISQRLPVLAVLFLIMILRIEGFTAPLASLQPAIHRRSPSSPSSTALCGIAGLRAWYKNAFPSAVSELNRSKKFPPFDSFDHVLIDMNSVLHICLRRNKSNFEKSLISTIDMLDEQLSVTRPRKSVVLAFDGPPPAAKLMTQKKRRQFSATSRLSDVSRLIKSARSSQHITKTDGILFRWHTNVKWREEKKKQAIKGGLDAVMSMLLTPGTVNMSQATAAAVHYIWNHLSTSPKYAGITFSVSSSNAAGEGEVKLLEWLLRPDSPVENGDSAILVGGDGDLLLEALAVPPGRCKDLFVFTPGGKERDSCISVWELTRELMKRFPEIDTVKDLYNVRMDLVMLLLLNGNDYLPRMGRAGFSELFDAYQEVLKSSIADAGGARGRPTFLFDLQKLDINAKFASELFKLRLHPQDMGGLEEDRHAYLSALRASQKRATIAEVVGAPSAASKNATGESTEHCKTVGIHTTSLLQELVVHGAIPRSSNAMHPNTNLVAVGVEEMLTGNAANVTFNISMTVGGSFGTEKVTFYRPQYQNQRRQQVVEKLSGDALSYIFGDDWSSLLQPWEERERGAARGEAPELSAFAFDTDEYVRGIKWNMHMYLVGGCLDYSYNYGKRPAPGARALHVHFSCLSEMESCTRSSSSSRNVCTISGDATRPLPAPLAGITVLPPSRRGLIDLSAFPQLKFKELYAPLLRGDNKIDDLYEACTSATSGALDYGKFKAECLELLNKNFKNKHKENYLDFLARVQESHVSAEQVGEILVGDKCWAQFSSKSGGASGMTFEPPTLELVKYANRLPVLESNDNITVKHVRHEPQLWVNSTRYEDMMREEGEGRRGLLLHRLDAKRPMKEKFKTFRHIVKKRGGEKVEGMVGDTAAMNAESRPVVKPIQKKKKQPKMELAV